MPAKKYTLRQAARILDIPYSERIYGVREAIKRLRISDSHCRCLLESGKIKGKKLGPHTLRHSGANLVASETGSALVVKALLQHDNIGTSMGYITDVEDVLQQKYSPMEILKKRYSKAVVGDRTVSAEQLQLTDGVACSEPTVLVPVEAEWVEGDVDLVSAMFPEIGADTSVRPALDAEVLNLIRDVFVWYARYNEGSSVVVRLSMLMKRWLSKQRAEGA